VPSELALGAPPGERAEGAFALYNDGDGPLTVSATELVGVGFELLDAAPITLPAGEAWSLGVVFTAPEEIGVSAGVLTLFTDDPAAPSPTLALAGTTEVPDVSVDDVALEAVMVGCVASAEVRVESAGTAPVTLTALSMEGEGYAVEAPPLPTSLAPGEALTLTASFSPLVEGASEGRLTVSADGLADRAVALSGEGTAPPLEELRWAIDEARPVDLVVAVDVSAGMAGHQIAVADALGLLGDQLHAAGADWRALVVNNLDGCGVVVDGDSPGWGARFTDVLGEADAGRDLLARLGAAVGEEPCRAGWPRPSALVHLLAASSGDDESGGAAPSWLPGGLAAQAASAIVGPAPAGCEDASPGWRYIEVAGLTGGALLSICERAPEAWADALLAASLVPRRSDYIVPGGLDEPTLAVAVDGEPLDPEWWSWDADSWTLSVDPSRLSLGGELVASWSGVPDCEESR